MLKERCSVETLDVGQWSFLVRGRQDQSCRSPPAQFPLGQPHSICVFVPIYIVHLCIFYLCICEVTYLCICGKTKGQAQRPAKQPYRTARRSSRPDRLQKLRFCKVFFREFIGQHSLNIKKVSWEPRQWRKISTSSNWSVGEVDVVFIHLWSIIVSKMRLTSIRVQSFLAALAKRRGRIGETKARQRSEENLDLTFVEGSFRFSFDV